jgi:carboxyl-terminal processing protease
MWNTVKWGMFTLGIALMLALTGVVGYSVGDQTGSGSQVVIDRSGSRDTDYDILEEIQEILEEDFVNPEAVNPDALLQSAIQGQLEALGDPHTQYLTPEQMALGTDIISGTFQGIGAQVDQDPVTGEIVIVAPFRGSPAEKAGIRPGDVILAVDGESTQGWSVQDAVQRIRGEQGQPVTLTVRHTDGSQEDITIVRETIVIPTVFTHEVRDETGAVVPELAYIELQQFTEQTVNDLREELERIKDEGYRGIILDLRRNPGGGLDATVQVADMFLDQGVVLTQVDREGNRTEYRAHEGGEAVDIPLAVLVGPGSASGAEVLAGALRDHGRAKLIGEQTFGKGSVNHLRQLSNGGALYVTIARWLTPNGEQIEGVGLTPDIAVAPGEDELLTGSGPQLFAAIDYLRGELAASP